MTALRGNEVERTALRLHCQFVHLPYIRIVNLIQDAGIKNIELERAIKKVT